ncbi:MAG: hypothetical protein IH881_15395 [Myxococcales bacterium]|nr:hypothetical protein [Myxococcales bacterium]
MKLQRRHWILLSGFLAVAAGLTLWLNDQAAYSNIHSEDYVGPDACVECHEQNHRDNFDSWQTHSHRVMNQDATEESVKGDFSGARLDYQDGYVIFHRIGPAYLMSIYENGEPLRRLQVTRTIGSLYVQYYIGKQIFGPETRRHPSYHLENKFKFGYSITLKRWLPELFFDSTVAPESEYQKGGAYGNYFYSAPDHRWNTTCLICHNTYPYERRLVSLGSWLGGYPEESVKWPGDEAYGGDEDLIKKSQRVTLPRDLVTVGISCESCHFGGREHASENREIRFVATSPKMTIEHPITKQPAESDRDDPFVINSICAQCHSAHLNLYPNGSPSVNSNESTALASGACASVIKCTDCHSPHERGDPSGSPDRESDLQACLNCHPQFDAAADRAKHTHHSDAVSCLDCHMPRTVSGLDTIVRSHQISKPIDPSMIESASPNACNLCHLDKPISWTLTQLERNWNLAPPPRARVEAGYGGNLNRPTGEVWVQSASQFVRSAALEASTRSPHLQDRIAPLIRGLSDEFPYNRTLALVALERHIGRRVSVEEFDLVADAEERAQRAAALENSLRAAGW